MAYADIVTVLAVLQFILFGFQVGGARAKYGVKAPATTGNEIFERFFRIQQNTLELLICLIPCMRRHSEWSISWGGKCTRPPTREIRPGAVSATA